MRRRQPTSRRFARFEIDDSALVLMRRIVPTPKEASPELRRVPPVAAPRHGIEMSGVPRTPVANLAHDRAGCREPPYGVFPRTNDHQVIAVPGDVVNRCRMVEPEVTLHAALIVDHNLADIRI